MQSSSAIASGIDHRAYGCYCSSGARSCYGGTSSAEGELGISDPTAADDFSLRDWYMLKPDAPKGRCPTWVFLAATRKAFKGSGDLEDGDVQKEDVIVALSSLIDQVGVEHGDGSQLTGQGLILGNVAYSQQQLVMKPSADGFGGFPRVSTVVPRAVIANA